jgi:Protein of unknown function DUF262/HNH endonuclease
MVQSVNLDAMIKREDLDVTENDPAKVKIGTELKLSDLEQSSPTFNILRKPDFQRETANWGPEKIADMIESFLDGDLIPSVIIWRSNKSGKLFVIDGAHRLSALIAWINDDYGDASLSNEFFHSVIEVNQKKIAKKARDLIASRVGSYQHLKGYVLKPEGAPNERALLRARNIGSLSITLQDVRGDVANAERSFLKINQSATPIDPTELIIIQARRKPNAIATRALVRSGVGHAYWGTFEQHKEEISKVARDVYDNLFKPLLEYPSRTLSLPAAGEALTADSLDLVFSLVNYVNGIEVSAGKKAGAVWKIKAKNGTPDRDLLDDVDGKETLNFLYAVKRETGDVFGGAAGSLALHPGVYCYGATGRFQPTAFFAAVEFVRFLALHKRFDSFTDGRARFENFIISYRHFMNQVVGAYGSRLRSLPALLKLFKIIYESIRNGLQDNAVISAIKADKELSFITEITDEDRRYGRNFSRETSNAVYLRTALAKELTCGICGARIHAKTITLDHKVRKADGGDGSPDNAQLAHPYCNHGYKERKAHANAEG